MITIDTIPDLLLGSWQFEDGRKINFLKDTEFELYSSDGSPLTEGKYFLKQNQGFIQIALPDLMIAVAIINSITENQFVFTDLGLNGEKTKTTLSRLV